MVGAKLAAIDQDDPGGLGWCLQGGFDDDSTSHAVADQHGGRQGECLHDFGDISPVPLDGAIGGHPRTGPMPAQIDCDSLVTRGEMRCLRVPVAVRTTEAMDEHDRWAASACDDVVDEWHFRLMLVTAMSMSVAPTGQQRNAELGCCLMCHRRSTDRHIKQPAGASHSP